MTDRKPSQPESASSNDTTPPPAGEAEDEPMPSEYPETDLAGDQATTADRSQWPAGSLAEPTDAPDSLTEKVQPAADRAEDAEAEPELRVSTILGPLPGRVTAKQTRDLNDAVHQILVIGLAVSSILLLIGLLSALLEASGIPSTTLSFAAALQQALALQPAGFLSLGLLSLIATPIIRVIGSVIVFTWERDWLYTGVTLLVLTVMIISVLVGQA